MIEIPLFVWKAIYQDRAVILPPKPKREGYPLSAYVPPYHGPSLTYPPIIPLQFIDADYIQFYRKTNQNPHWPEWSMCRVCLTVCWGRQGRLVHQDMSKECRHYLLEALRDMRVGKLCVVCGSATNQTQHFAYLCCEACIEIWRHDEFRGRGTLFATLLKVGTPQQLLEDESWDGYAC